MTRAALVVGFLGFCIAALWVDWRAAILMWVALIFEHHLHANIND